MGMANKLLENENFYIFYLVELFLENNLKVFINIYVYLNSRIKDYTPSTSPARASATTKGGMTTSKATVAGHGLSLDDFWIASHKAPVLCQLSIKR